MKLFSALVLTGLLASTSALAQSTESTPDVSLSKARGNKVGIGVSIEPAGALVNVGDNEQMISSFPASLRVPLHFGNVKLEPELAVLSTSTSEEFSGEKSSESGTIMRIGSGLYYNTPVSADASLYVGPKIGIVRFSKNTETDFFPETSRKVETSRTDIFFAGMVGGEYFFSTRFSIGAEVGLEYQSRGEESVTETPADPTPNSDVDQSGSNFTTKAGLTGRFYF